jgi:mannose-1-phosphate guanylyltransferase
MSSEWLFVLAGGSGTRFWPRSRASLPKQFLPLGGDEPLLATTVRRFLPWIAESRIVILTTKVLEAESKKILAEFPEVQILAEPESRNTAPALVMAMEWLRAINPEATAVIVPADHWISDIPEYLAIMKKAAEAARTEQSLCTVGIQPYRPETGYGYIRGGEVVKDGIMKVDRFVEKPSREVAETMVQSSEYFWNAGMFIWTVPVFFRELGLHAKELVQAFEPYRKSLQAKRDESAGALRAYANSPAISIDYALLEKSRTVLVLPGASFGWNDLGSFISLEEVFPKTEGGVAKAAKVIALDSLANIIDAPGKTVALLGVTDMILVDAGDVILLAAKERAQDVKRLVERLKAEGRKDLT